MVEDGYDGWEQTDVLTIAFSTRISVYAPVRQFRVVYGESESRVTASAPIASHSLYDLVLTKAFKPTQQAILHRRRSIVTSPCHRVNSQSLRTRDEHPRWLSSVMNSGARESVRPSVVPMEPGGPLQAVVAEGSRGRGGQPMLRPGRFTPLLCVREPMTVAYPRKHPQRASVASLRLFTINRNDVHVRRNTHCVGSTRCSPGNTCALRTSGCRRTTAWHA